MFLSAFIKVGSPLAHLARRGRLTYKPITFLVVLLLAIPNEPCGGETIRHHAFHQCYVDLPSPDGHLQSFHFSISIHCLIR